MHRRTILATVVATGLAGCVNDGDETGTNAEDHVVAATEYIDDAGERIDEEGESFGDLDDGASFATAAIFTALDRADEELTSAEAKTDDEELLTRIEALQTTVALFRSFTRGLDDFEDSLNDLSTATSYADNGRYDDAIETAQSSRSSFESARSHLDDTEDHRQSIDADVLDQIDGVSLVDVGDKLTDLQGAIEALEIFIDGYVALNRGFQRYDAAIEATEDEDWSEAADEFADARNHFDEGADYFRGGEDEAPDQFTGTFVDVVCVADSLEEASRHFEDAMEAVDRGDADTYEQKLSAAESAADQCA